MRIIRPFLFLFLLHGSSVNAQYSFAHEQEFASHLFEHRFYKEYVEQTETILKNYAVSQAGKDSISFNQGLCYHKLGLHDESAVRYSLISNSSPLYFQSIFLASAGYSEEGSAWKAEMILDKFIPADSVSRSLKDLYLFSVYLLKNDVKGFNTFSASQQFNDPFFVTRQKTLVEFSKKMIKAKKKNGFTAGLLSAIIPGMGKIYAGKIRSGLTSMIPVTVLGLQAWEAYQKDGLKSPRFIVFGSMFSLFYIGNIWGSVLSVSVHKQEIQNEIHHEVVLGMHIALDHVLGTGR